MTTWDKRDDQVTLEDNQNKKVEYVEFDSLVSASMPNTKSILCGKKYISLLVWLIVAVIFFTTTFIVVIFVVKKNIDGGDELSCLPQSVNYRTADILSNLNRDVDPCDNFYEFACGGWEKNNPMPEGKEDWSTWTKQGEMLEAMITELLQETQELTQNTVVNQAKLLYQKCIELDNQNGNEEEYVLKFVRDTLDFYGGWPIISGGDHWNSSNFNWMKSFAGLKQRFNTPIMLDINSYRDAENAHGMNIINISRALPDFSDLWTFWASTDRIVDLSQILIDSKANPNISEASFQEQAYRIRDIHFEPMTEWKISKIPKRHGFTENFGFATVSKLQEMLDDFNGSRNSINMLELLSHVYENSGVDITETTMLYITDFSYLLKIQEYIISLNKTDLANYLHCQMVHEMIPRTPKQLWGPYFKEHYEPRGNQKMIEAKCTGLVRTRFRFVLESKLVKKEFGSATCFKKSRDGTRRLLDQFQKVFRDVKHTSNILHGNRSHNICIAFPDWTLDENRFQMEYAGLNLSLPTFLQQYLAFNEWEAVKRQRSPILPLGINECDWRLMENGAPLVAPEKNIIYLNWNILMPPFFAIGDHNKPYNLGAMGTILAHEFSHILDNTVLENFKLSISTHEENCLVKQYGNFYVNVSQPLQKQLYGYKTVRENVADNVGLYLAYMAFIAEKMLEETNNLNAIEQNGQDDFTDYQKFFIGFAQNWCHKYNKIRMVSIFNNGYDNHSPGNFRVLGTLQNSYEFSKAWNCPIGSKMNPDPSEHKKCIFISDKTP